MMPKKRHDYKQSHSLSRFLMDWRTAMAKRLTTILAPDGSTIYIQYDDDENDDLRARGVVEDIAERTQRFKDIMASTVRGYAAMVLHTVQQGMMDLRAPDKVCLEFGIQLGGEAGIPFVTKGTAEANVKATIEWTLGRERQG
jgi:Trypsin-co-occurring domain 1